MCAHKAADRRAGGKRLRVCNANCYQREHRLTPNEISTSDPCDGRGARSHDRGRER